MPESLYERLGGENAVLAAVDLFYQKVMADELTRPFFSGWTWPRSRGNRLRS